MIEHPSVDLGSPHLQCWLHEEVLHVRIDRTGRRNAMTQDMYRGVKRAAILADGDPAVAALCLTGTDDVFAVGGDMSGQGTTDPTLAAEADPTDHFPFRHLERCRKPTVAVVNGICHAGGMNLMLYCDFAIASDRATFRAPELLRGAPDAWMAARLTDYVGVGTARWLLFTAATVDAETALRMGLVARVVRHDELPDTVAETIGQLRLLAPRSTAMIKDHINTALGQPDPRIFSRSIMSDEMIEGFRAFRERRDPRWRPDPE